MKKSIEKQQAFIKELLELIKANPGVEIIPMVATDVVGGDDFATWAGRWGNAELTQYYISDERIYFKSDDWDELVNEEIDRLIETDKIILGDYDDTPPEIEAAAEKNIDALPWVECIVVNITPEVARHDTD